MLPWTPVVDPTATLGRLRPASCSWVWYSALLLLKSNVSATDPAAGTAAVVEASDVGACACSCMVCTPVAGWASLAPGARDGLPQAAATIIIAVEAVARANFGRGA